MLSPVTKRNVLRILPFGFFWFVFSLLYVLLERGLLGNLQYYPITGNPYSFVNNLLLTPFAALLTGLGIGTLEVLYVNRLFSNKSFLQKIIYKSVSYFLVILLFLFLLTSLANMVELHASLNNPAVWKNAWMFFTSAAFWTIAIYIAAIIGLSLFYNEVSDNLGNAVLINFLTGRYHTPKEEERIFMFLDMKSSTTIAESMGHTRYFKLLARYYADLSGPIVAFGGEIYQYVGDEIVVSWKTAAGLQNNNCIHCFFAMKDAIRQQAAFYQQAFGVLPGFKAGFHVGRVTTGEIGLVKKEIIFTGDTLNSTARIQELCNSYQTDLLLSGQLAERLLIMPSLRLVQLGNIELRGREEKITLYSLQPQ